MKKILVVMVIAFMFVGCDMAQDIYLEANYCGHDLYEIEIDEELNSLEEIGEFLARNITYISDGSENYTQSPEETWERKGGDCEDFAILFLNIAYFELGLKGELIFVEYSNISKSIEDGGDLDHAMVRYNGVIYEPQTGDIYTGSVGYYYSFDRVFD